MKSARSAAPRIGSPAVETAVLLTEAESLLARAIGKALAPRGMSWPQALSLFVLAEQDGPISATRLVEQLGLGRTAMTSVVDRLERRGWVQRRPSAVDRRVADLLLTDAGHTVVGEVRSTVCRAIDTCFTALAPKELATWCGGVDRLIEALRATAPPAGAQ